MWGGGSKTRGLSKAENEITQDKVEAPQQSKANGLQTTCRGKVQHRTLPVINSIHLISATPCQYKQHRTLITSLYCWTKRFCCILCLTSFGRKRHNTKKTQAMTLPRPPLAFFASIHISFCNIASELETPHVLFGSPKIIGVEACAI